ncbi:MAG: type II secretion system protein [Desulfovibrio sp.]|nr:type II secretion system protein [Desulfovibrio sp.]
MTNIELLITIAVLLMAVGSIIAIILQRLQRARATKRHLSVMRTLLETAQAQNELFDISSKNKTTKHNALSGTLVSLGEPLEIEVLTYASPEFSGEEVDVYFRIRSSEGYSFYKFTTTVQSVQGSIKRSRLSLTFPQDITAGQKRQFYRVNPPKESVRIIGLWNMPVGKAIPRDTSAIGIPLLYYKYGTGNETIQIADISGTGVAFSFPMDDLDSPPISLVVGSQVLCLIVYQMGKGGRMVTFCCTCDVLNVRKQENPPMLILGMRFTNWALLEQGKSEITWFHCKPDSGVSPVIQWVMQLDREQHNLL